jgi:ornithine carbamoyltransferase
LRSADFLYPDVWVSMGELTEMRAARIEEMRPFLISSRVMGLTGNPDTRFIHRRPAMHDRHTELGEMLYDKVGLAVLEVTTDVFESSASIVFDQAENRLHTIKAAMVAMLEEPRGAAQS